MKKILFFVCIAFAMVGCKKDVTVAEGKDTLPADTADVDKMLDFPPIITLNKANLDSAWMTTNRTRIVLNNYDKVYIDLSKIGTDPEDIDDWLSLNDGDINFPLNYWFIEYTHLIQDPSVTVATIPSTSYGSLTFSQIKQQLRDAGAPNPVEYNAYKHTYDKYIKVSMSGTNVKVESSDFDDNEIIYSFPLLESIVQNNHLTDPVFEFAPATLNGKSTIYFRVKETATSTSYVGHYDFSNKPPYLKFL